MDVLTSETCWALNNEIIKQVTSSWSLFIHLYMGSFILNPEFLPWSCGIEIESNLEFKESSAVGDSSKDSTEGSS